MLSEKSNRTRSIALDYMWAKYMHTYSIAHSRKHSYSKTWNQHIRMDAYRKGWREGKKS